MSKCGDISGRLPAFALGELDEALVGVVASHLRECAACAREAARLRQTVDLLTAALKESEPAVAGLSAARIAEIHRGGRRRSQQAGLRWFAQSHPALAAAASVAAVAGAGWLLVAGLRPWPREAAVAERLTAQPAAAAKPPVVLAAAAPSTHGNARETDAPGDAAEAALSPAPSLEQSQPAEPAMAFSLDVAASGPMARDEAGDKAAPLVAAESARDPASAPAPVALARRAAEPADRSSVAKAAVPLPRPSAIPSPHVTVQECVSPFDSARRLAILVLRSPENEKLDAAGGRLAGADGESGARTLRIRFDGRQAAGVRGVGGAARAEPRREGDSWVVDVAVGDAADGRPRAFLYEWTPTQANDGRQLDAVRSVALRARADDGRAAMAEESRMAVESRVVEAEAVPQALQPAGPGVIEVSVDGMDLRIERAGESGADDGAAARVAALLREALPDDPEAGAVLDAMRRAGWIE